MTAIAVKNLEKHFGQVKALDGLNLEVMPGSIYGFLGPNGAGKTTTMRILAGLAYADQGSVTFNGIDQHKWTTPSARIGYLPEEPSFYNWMTPLEFLDYVAQIFHLDHRTRSTRSNELIETVGLKDARKRRIGGFSHGMRQRLGLAQALINSPDILLLDEPVSALDPAGRKEILELIHSLAGKSTVLMSTHILADVERICDTIGIINAGKMIIQSERNELLNRYAISGLDVELSNGSRDAINTIRDQFSQIEGVNSVSMNQNVLHIQTQDTAQVLERLMESIIANGIQTTRLEVVKPSLEDIFIQLTSEGKGKL